MRDEGLIILKRKRNELRKLLRIRKSVQITQININFYATWTYFDSQEVHEFDVSIRFGSFQGKVLVNHWSVLYKRVGSRIFCVTSRCPNFCYQVQLVSERFSNLRRFFFVFSVNLKTILSIDIAFEYNIQDTAEKMEQETTAIATAMDNMTAVYEPEEGERQTY